MTKTLSFLFCLALAACSPRKPAESVFEITGTIKERIAGISNLITKHTQLPSPLEDAYFLEQEYGDNRLGPADYTSFYALKVSSADVAAWRSALTPLQTPNSSIEYASPKTPVSWWVQRSDFDALDFYNSKPITGRSHGWIGIDARTGWIFIFTTT